MARSNGPFGPPGAPPRRRPGDDPFGAPAGAPAQSAGHWPPQSQHGYIDHAPQPTPQPGYHFPPQEQQPAYGYSNPQLLAHQQWPQQGEPQAFELNYQAYSPAEPSPFQGGGHYQDQGYADQDGEYGDDFYEDQEPRRGRRWVLITVALVGAIGVGGALAYTYRSLVAPNSRIPLVKVDPKVKSGADKRVPVRVAEEPPPQASEPPPPPPQEEPPSENLGPRTVKTISINPGAAPPSQPQAPASAIPGITLYQPPQMPGQAAAPPPQAAPPVQPALGVQPPPVRSLQPSPQTGRVTIGTRPAAVAPPPPPPSETDTDEDPPAAASPPPRRQQVQTAAAAPRAPAPAPGKSRESVGGFGFVAVLSSQKSSMEALKVFADLQQRYVDVLGDKTPDVQEADLTARGLGTMYRLVVGPPGSHNAASNVCTQLKSAGYVGCWVKEY